MVIRLSIALISSFVTLGHCAFLDDKVSSLPDMGEFDSWGLYSGYLDILGQVGNFYSGRHLHYVFA